MELTVKSLKRYKDLFRRLSLYNLKSSYREDDFIISDIIYITTPQLFNRLQSILSSTPSNVGTYLFKYQDIIDNEFNFTESFIDQPDFDKNKLDRLRGVS